MSDPAKSPEEIEDVLASIRRLVSDHDPVAEGTDQTPESAAQTGSADVERLVLTPSLRVAEPEGSGPDGDEGPEALVADLVQSDDAFEPAGEAEGSADWQPEDRLSEYDAVGETSDDSAEDDTSAEDDAEAPEEQDEDADADVADQQAEEDSAEAVPEQSEPVENDAMPGLSDLGDAEDVDPAARGFESETGDEEWPEAGAEAALLSLVAARGNAAEDGQAPDTAEADAQPETTESDQAPAEPADAEADTGEPEDETPRTPIFSRRVAFAEAKGQDETPDEGAHEAPHEAAEEAHATVDAEDLGEDPNPFTFPDGEDGILDEETLREIIVDVVREELQGVLGQRITRNVRKMVRREIRMALAAEDLE